MLPSPHDVLSVVEEEMVNAGGKVVGCVMDDRRLFLRGVLAPAREVREDDAVRGGVAVMMDDLTVHVHPFTYREVCRNGAIMACVLDTRRIQRIDSDAVPYGVYEVMRAIRDAVRECCDPKVFLTLVKQLRRAASTPVDLDISVLLELVPLGRRVSAEILSEIMTEYVEEVDESMFGVMNAVTRVARDEPDPVVRWDLEELGGAIPAMLRNRPKPSNRSADVLQPAFRT